MALSFTRKSTILLGVSFVLLVAFVVVEFYDLGDFLIYLQASRDMGNGINIYDQRYGGQAIFPYMGSPVLAYLLYPLTLLPTYVSGSIWKILNVILLWRICSIIELNLGLNRRVNSRSYGPWLILSLVSVSFMIYRNFHLSQFSILLLYLILQAVDLIRRDKKSLSGPVLISLGIVIKVLPIVAVPYLLFRGYWKQCLWVLLFTILLLFSPAISHGWDETILLYQGYLERISPAQELNLYDVDGPHAHGIASLVSTLLIEGISNNFTLDYKRNIFNLDPEIVLKLILGIKLVFLISVLFIMDIKSLFRDEKAQISRFYELSYILLITPLLFPQMRLYNFVFLLPAMSYLIYIMLIEKEFSSTGKILFVIGIVLLNLELLLGHFRELYWHYKSVTYATLIVLGFMIYWRPSRLKSDD